MHLAVKGVAYHVEVEGSGPAVFFLHGFTGSSETWTPHLAAMKAFTTIRIDFLGHGRSDAPAAMQRYGMDACVDDLLVIQDRLGIERCAIVGYSMGGRVAMRVALRAPERLWALVLESASPGIANAADRHDRMVQDATLAARIRKEGVAAFADHWQALPLFASQSRLPDTVRQALRNQRLQHTAEGLANSLVGLGAVDRSRCCRLYGIYACPSCCWRGHWMPNTVNWPMTWQPCCRNAALELCRTPATRYTSNNRRYSTTPCAIFCGRTPQFHPGPWHEHSGQWIVASGQ